jgi:thiosulfate/3-mercaptopyruvate sulfurtransferase
VAFTTAISPEELHARLGDPNLVVLDCRHSLADFSLGRRLYDEAHVPGAFFADVEKDLAGRHERASSAPRSRKLRALLARSRR